MALAAVYEAAQPRQSMRISTVQGEWGVRSWRCVAGV